MRQRREQHDSIRMWVSAFNVSICLVRARGERPVSDLRDECCASYQGPQCTETGHQVTIRSPAPDST